MADDDDAISFDPQVVLEAESRQYEKIVATDEAISNYLTMRANNYQQVFSRNNPAVEWVLADMAVWARAYSPTWNKDQKIQDLLEGRREFYLRIMEIARLPHDVQFKKYMDAVTQKGR